MSLLPRLPCWSYPSQGMLQKLDPSLLGSAPLSYFLGTLGMPGMTAWMSLKKIAEPGKQGEVAYVSGAAGAVGLVAGQLLKNVYGCKVIGSAGSDDKVRRGGGLPGCGKAWTIVSCM
jgi:NADPH-dependent curcumin reductase CurA